MATLSSSLSTSSGGHREVDYINAKKGIWSWMTTVDHKRIGIMYLFFVLASFLVGGLLALLVRLSLFSPDHKIGGSVIFDAEAYNRIFTLHGAIMVFMFIIPSIPAALGCITSSPGSGDCRRRARSLRCFRFNADVRVMAMRALLGVLALLALLWQPAAQADVWAYVNDKGVAQKPVDASETLFGRDYNEALVHQVVVAYTANGRQGTRAQKTRAEVRHSTKKPWRQKGTGRARAGMTSSPLWRGGGRIFPNKADENFTQKLNRKMYRAGMAAILSQLVREDRLSVIEAFSIDQPKTKVLAGKLRDLGMDHVLILTEAVDDNLYLSARNLPNVLVMEARHADPVSLMRYEKVLVTRAAVKHLEEALA